MENSWINPLDFILFLSYFPNMHVLFPTFYEISSTSSSNLSIEYYSIILLLISKSSYLFFDFSRILFLFHKLMVFLIFYLLPNCFSASSKFLFFFWFLSFMQSISHVEYKSLVILKCLPSPKSSLSCIFQTVDF